MDEIGRVLKEGRIELGFEITDIARYTCINPHYIRAMEDGRFEIIPKVFDKGYLRIYASFLHIDIEAILNLYDEKQGRCSATNA